ncbi:YopX family protein [Brevibacillus laterosporus]
MREIKFRAWDKEDKYMLDWVLIKLDVEYSINQLLEMNRFEMMQFTGLHDKNGMEIYEGDIVLGRSEPATGTVEFSYGSIIVDWHGPDIDDLRDYHEFLEVIGNIYENPELL